MPKLKSFSTLVAGSAMLIMTSHGVRADECTGPCVAYSLDYEVFSDFLNSGDGWYHDIYPSLETAVSLEAGNGLALNSDIVVEPATDPKDGHNRLFGDIGAYFKSLNVSFETEDFRLVAGQFEPKFGRAWDVLPGLHGTSLAEDYELADRLGGEANYFFNAGGFHNMATASVFTLDRSALSGSIFTKRPTNSMSDGGAGNTKGVSSVALALTGCMGTDPDACYDDGSLGYQIGALYQRAGRGDDGSETGLVGSLNKTFKISDDQDLKLFGELTYFNNFEGTDSDIVFATASAAYHIADYTLSLAGTRKSGLNNSDDNETFIDASAIYNLNTDYTLVGEAWSVGFAYDHVESSDVSSDSIALQVKAELEGSHSLR